MLVKTTFIQETSMTKLKLASLVVAAAFATAANAQEVVRLASSAEICFVMVSNPVVSPEGRGAGRISGTQGRGERGIHGRKGRQLSSEARSLALLVAVGGNADARENSSRLKWYSERVGNVLVDLSRFCDSLGAPRPRLGEPLRGKPRARRLTRHPSPLERCRPAASVHDAWRPPTILPLGP